MAKICGSDNLFLAFTSRLFCYCLVAVAIIGPMCPTTVANKITAVSVTPTYIVLGSPVWIGSDESLYFIDEANGDLIRYHQESEPVKVNLQFGDILKFLVPVSSNGTQKFAIGCGNWFGVLAWDGKSQKPIPPDKRVTVSEDIDEQCTCAKVDVSGRLWIGTSYRPEGTTGPGGRKGKLYMVDKDGNVTKKLENIGVVGGITWSPGDKYLYYTDKQKKTIVLMQFNSTNGDLIGEGKEIFKYDSTGKGEGLTDGITVDTDGFLWVAIQKNAAVLKIDPVGGTVLTEVSCPGVSSANSVSFGGSSLGELYVTTDYFGEESTKFPSSGALFRATDTGSTGFKAISYQFGLA